MRKYQRNRVSSREDTMARLEEPKRERWLEQASTQLGKLGAGPTTPPALKVPSNINPPDADDLSKFFKLIGRPGGQYGRGGTGAGQSLQLGSTDHPTKGFIYFGLLKQTAYDETNDRIGVNQPIPLARLHLKAATFGGTQTLTPTTDYWQGGWGAFFVPDHSICVQAVDANGSQSPGNAALIGVTYGFTTFNTSSSTSGWTLNIVARCQTPNDASNCIGADLVVGVASFTPGVGWTGAGGTGGTINNVGGTIQEYFFGPVGGGRTLLANANSTYTRAITPTEMATMFAALNANPGYVLFVQFVSRTNLGDSGVANKFIDIDQVYFTGPGLVDPIPLQKWEDSTLANTLKFTDDGASSKDLELAGDRALRISSGGGSSGLRMLTASTNGRLEAGTAAQANMNLVLSGARAIQGTLATIDFVTTYLTNLIRIAGGSPAANKILAATDGAGNALWQTAAALGLVTSTAPTFAYVAVTATYAILTTDFLVDCTANTFTVTLPTAVGVTGRIYDIKNSGTGVITVATTGGQTIDGSATALLQVQNVSITVMSDGANWKVF